MREKRVGVLDSFHICGVFCNVRLAVVQTKRGEVPRCEQSGMVKQVPQFTFTCAGAGERLEVVVHGFFRCLVAVT